MSQKRRLLIAFDGRNVFLRKVLAIMHDGSSGEVIYYSKPIEPAGFMRVVMFLFKLVSTTRSDQ